MSGGFFDYQQYKINEICSKIQLVICAEEGVFRLSEYKHNLSPEVLAELKNGLAILSKAFVYAHRIDWLLSGDDDEESFLWRLEEGLSNPAFNE